MTSLAKPFESQFICHGEDVAYVRQLYVSFPRYRKRSTEEERFD